MASGKKLGFFWGDQKFYLVETSGNLPARVIVIPLPPGEQDDPQADIHLIAFIQKSIRDGHISTNQVNLSVSAAEVIIRSFIIPSMPLSEISAGIEFEIKKYLPFSLKDLSYVYHPIMITENRVKKIRIIFVAVRRTSLERYTRILEQAGLDVVFSEPAPLSVVRALLAKKVMPAEHRTAVMQIEANTARIVFIFEGVVTFIHEFRLKHAPDPAQSDDAKAIKNRFLGEVRNALEFYTREYSQKITHMEVLSAYTENPYGQWIQEDLGIAVKSVEPVTITGTQPVDDQMGIVSAFGVAMANDVKMKAVFNFSRKQAKSGAFFMGQAIDIREYMHVVKTAVVCAIVLVAAFVLLQVNSTGTKKKVEDLKAQQSLYSDQAAEDIQGKIDHNHAILKKYKDIPFKSEVLPVLVYIPSQLQQGVWFDNFNIKRSGPAVSDHWIVDVTGYIYNPDTNQEIRLVNELAGRIKKEKHLAKYFTNVNLMGWQLREIDKYTVVTFTLNCS